MLFTSKIVHAQMYFIPSTAFPAPLCTALTNGQQHYVQISSRNSVTTQNVTSTAPNSTQIIAPQFLWVPPVPNLIQIRRNIHKIRQNLVYGCKERPSLHRFTKIKFLNGTKGRWSAGRMGRKAYRILSTERVSLYRWSRKSRLLEKRSLV
jgi:hypothetical protein